MGVILGGRIGWCIFYGTDVISENWLNIFHIWDGGMSFHGGSDGRVGGGGDICTGEGQARIADVCDFRLAAARDRIADRTAR